MRKLFRILTLLLIAVLALSCFCFADEEESPYRLGLYRMNDFTDQLSEEMQDSLNEQILEKMNALKLDLPIALEKDFDDETPEEYGERLYSNNELGYGADREGLFLVVDTVNQAAVVLAFGRESETNFPSGDRATLAANFIAAYQDQGCEPAIRNYLDDVNKYLQSDAVPAWYPENVDSFQDFHNPDAPCVVDNANLFTDDEERMLTVQLTQLKLKHSADFVLFTDVSAYGLDHMRYAADFYTFNGYGVGADYNGMILFICMDRDDRGVAMVGFGESKSLMNDKSVRYFSKRMKPYMTRGEYTEGTVKFFQDADQVYTRKRVPLTTGEWLAALFFTTLLSLIIMLIVRAILRKKMKVISIAAEADQYLVKDTFKLRNSQDFFLRTVTTRQKIERSSSGGSSYSGRGSSSSGRSYSGGGFRF